MRHSLLNLSGIATFSALLAIGSVQAEPKRVLVCSVPAGFQHSSIPVLNQALAELAQGDERFEIVTWVKRPDIRVAQKPQPPRAPREDAPEAQHARYRQQQADYEKAIAAWTPEKEAAARQQQAAFDEALAQALAQLSPESLRANRIDAVVFSNTSGNPALPDLDGFLDWIEAGGNFIGIHAATDTFKDKPRYVEMIQGAFQSHGPQVGVTMRAGDTDHPANGGIGDTWTLVAEEIYLFKDHDQDKVRALWYLPRHPNRPDEPGYYPIAWCRMAGKGRVFYTALGHRHDLIELAANSPGRKNPVETAQQFRSHLLGGMLWALGLEEGSAEPNPEAIVID